MNVLIRSTAPRRWGRGWPTQMGKLRHPAARGHALVRSALLPAHHPGPAGSGLCSPLPSVDPCFLSPARPCQLDQVARPETAVRPAPRPTCRGLPSAMCPRPCITAGRRKLLAAPSMPRRPQVDPGGLPVQQEGWQESCPSYPLLEGPPFMGIRVTPFQPQFSCLCTSEL